MNELLACLLAHSIPSYPIPCTYAHDPCSGDDESEWRQDGLTWHQASEAGALSDHSSLLTGLLLLTTALLHRASLCLDGLGGRAEPGMAWQGKDMVTDKAGI